MSTRRPLTSLEAAGGLRFALFDDGHARIGWGEPDWLGPVALALEKEAPPALRGWEPFSGEDDLGPFRGLALGFSPLPWPVRASVRAYTDQPVLVFRSEATDELVGLATGELTRPALVWPWLSPGRRDPGGAPPGARGFGHQLTEFSFPTLSGDRLADFFLFPNRPAALAPLWLIAPGGRCLMLAPLDGFHDQVIAVPRGPGEAARGVRCGWSGDLDSVPAGFATELALWAGPGPRRALEAWAAALRRRHAVRRPSRYADDTVARLSYWTDNGAAYWYRSEPGMDVTQTLAGVAASLRGSAVPVRAFELDSWFYPHEKTRPVNPQGQEHVPPTGMLSWEPRADLLPDGIEGLRKRLGDPPLILHGRHLSSASPYLQEYEAWVDGDRAHPIGEELFDRLLAQAASWGAISYEQDWLVEIWLGVRGLRERPGRVRAWQEGLDAAAARHGLSLIWCMATPADFFQTLTLNRVVAIRTSGDYRYLSGNASHWVRFLYTNALARALGLLPFKDVFLTARDADGLDGDPHAEAEAMLAALSAGPVGIGDRIGRTDPDLVRRTCRADGLLVKPDLPIAALERCFLADAWFEPALLVGETISQHPAGRFVYLAAMNAWRGGATLRGEVSLADLGDARPTGPFVVYDWRSGRFARGDPSGALTFELAPSGWDLRVLCPWLPAGVAVFGDTRLYATAGDRRLQGLRATDSGFALGVLGARGEAVRIEGCSERPLARVSAWTPTEGERALSRAQAETPGGGFWQDAAGGRFEIRVEIPASGWLRLSAELR
jgi:hypothetical protein